MTILFIDQFNEPGGAQQCLLDLIGGVLQRGWTPVVMLPGEGVLSRTLRAMNVQVVDVACGPYRSGPKTVADMFRFLRDLPRAASQIHACRMRYGVTVVYVNGPRLLPAAGLAAGGTELVFHCHSLFTGGALKWLTALPLRRRRARVIASSQFVGAPLVRYVPAERFHVIYNGVPASALRTGRGETFRIGVIGRIAPEKGQALFVDAVRILANRLPGLRAVISGAALFSGEDYERQVRKSAADLKVEFTGWLQDVTPVLTGLDLLVVPSTPVDATPRVILQAFAAKVPVVAFANEGFRELIDDGRTGYLVETRTAEALASKIESVLASEPTQSVTDAGYREWQSRFSIRAYRQNILNLLNPRPCR